MPEKKIKPKELQTSNISKEVKKYSIENSLHPTKIDFDVVNCITEYCEIQNANDQIQDWRVMDAALMEKLGDDDFILNENIRLRQKYEIRLKEKDEDSGFSLNISFGENKSMTKLAILIRKDSKIKISRDLTEKIISEIEKEKLLHGYFIRVWNADLQTGVSSLVINLSENGKLTKDYQINIGSCHGGSKSVDDKMFFYYKTKKEAQGKDKTFIGVKQNELIMEYRRPQEGEPGRNCKGQYIPTQEPRVTQEPKFEVGDGIEIKEDDDTIKYFAAKNGVVTFEDNVYNVVTDMSFAMLNFKETGSIKAGLDSGVKLNIEEKDPMKDAISAGVDIEVSEIDLKGNLGGDTKIKVKKLKVEGQTHTTSYSWAEDADIARHKGLIEGHKIKIASLESGKVIADEVRVVSAMGGDIRAKRVSINTLGSHVTVHASESIVINNIKGENNKLYITGAGDANVYKDYQRVKVSIEEFEQEMRYTGQTIEDYKQKIQQDKQNAIDLKEKLLEYKEKNIKPPQTLMNDFQRLKQVIKDNKSLEKKILKREKALQTLANADENIYDAEVLINNGWEGHSSVIFYSLSEDEGVEITPKEGTVKIYMLKAHEDDPDSYDQIIEE
jgi:hypothetical protein